MIKTVLISRERISIGERFGEYEIALIVRRNSAQLHGNRKLLVVKRGAERSGSKDRRGSWMKTSNEGCSTHSEGARGILAIPYESPARRAPTSM